MTPTQNWLDAAQKHPPILVFRLPDLGIYYASDPGHYSDDAGSTPHHAGMIKTAGMPTITRSIQNIYSGRSTITIGRTVLIDNGSFDFGFSGYQSTLRGTRLHGFVTFPGLAWSDAFFYLNARVVKASANDSSQLTLTLRDASAEKLTAAIIAETTYTSANLGTTVKNILVSAGAVWPTDFDSVKWSAWTAPGMPGSFIVTGKTSEGEVLGIVDRLIADTLTWWGFDREGKIVFEQFYDLGANPAVDVDLTSAGILTGNSVEQVEPVMRKEAVAYGSANPKAQTSKQVNLLTTDPWWPTAKEGRAVDPGLDTLADADSLALARITLLSAEHLTVRIATDSRMLAFDLGATVKLDLSKHNLPSISQNYHRVTAINEDPNFGTVTLTLWTNLGGPAI